MVRAMFSFILGDLAVHESPQQAAASMEAIDVEAGDYEAIYDQDGVLYQPVVEGAQVELRATEIRDYHDLVSRLKAFRELAGLALPEDAPDFPLAMARIVAERSWKRRWPKRPAWLSRRIHGPGPPRFDSL